jgi:hypothetical protein
VFAPRLIEGSSLTGAIVEHRGPRGCEAEGVRGEREEVEMLG